MDVRRLRYFLAVAEEQHFTRAAERLGIRQPPLSAQIHALEKEVGAPLFIRGSRSVALTEAGRLLLKEAREILVRMDAAEVLVQRFVRGETGSINIGFASATYLVALIPTIIRTYLQQYPKVSVHSQQSNTFELVDAMLEGRVDAAFVRPPIAHHDEFRLEPIVDEAMVAVLPHGHRLAAEQNLTLASLSEEPLTWPPRALGPGFYDSVIAVFHKAGLCPHIGQEAASLAAIPSLVAAGFGISILPQSLAQIRIEHVVYRPIVDSDLSAPIAFACRRTNSPPTARNLLTVARKCVQASKRTHGR